MLIAGLLGAASLALPAVATDDPAADTTQPSSEVTSATTAPTTAQTTTPTTAATTTTTVPRTTSTTVRSTASTVPTSGTTATTVPGTDPSTTPTTSATTAPKMPAPDGFPFPLDFGNKAVAAKARAEKAIAKATEQVDRYTARQRGLDRRKVTLQRRRAAFGDAYDQAARKLEATQRRIEDMIAELYKSGASPEALGALEAWRTADDVLSAQRGITLRDRSKESQDTLLADNTRPRPQAATRAQRCVGSRSSGERESQETA